MGISPLVGNLEWGAWVISVLQTRRRNRRARRHCRFVALAALSILIAVAAAPGVAVADTPAPWRIVPSPNLPTGHNHFQEVSCSSSIRCVAVGYNQDPTTHLQRPLAATLFGGTWTLGSVPLRGTSDNNLWNVSCVTYARCVAVGYYWDVNVGYDRTLIASYNGIGWSLDASPNRANVHNFLLGVDCFDATHCVAVGRSYDQVSQVSRSLVLTLTNGKWVITATPNRAGTNNLLADVSCGDVTHCVAVGYTVNTTNATFQTLILSRAQTSWSLNTSFDRANASNLLRDVSCPNPTTCVAVGAWDPSTANFDEHGLIETLSGGQWVPAITNDRAGYDNHLWGVSCSNELNCVAVGESQNADKARTLIQTLSGGLWSLTSPSPYRGKTFNYLYGLSCASRRACFAVGDYLNQTTGLFQTAILTNSP